jgi:predicted phage-related endonuclease
MVVADDAVVAAVERLRDVRKQLAELESARDDLESKIKVAMGDAAVLTINGEQAVTWRATKPAHRFNVTTFRGAHPDLYEQYCEMATSRRFLVK